MFLFQIEEPKIAVEESGNDGRNARVSIDPLDKGFGLTVGNALRRILLNELPGVAIKEIKFLSGIGRGDNIVNHVEEDLTEILLNLKSVNIKPSSYDKEFYKTIKLTQKGPCVVTAGDLDLGADAAVINPEQVIATVEAGGVFDVELTVCGGTGYEACESSFLDDSGAATVSATYTPVEKVNYTVEATRVGQSVDYDKLTLDVQTNGTLGASEAVSLAANLMNKYLSYFISLTRYGELEFLVKKGENPIDKILQTTIEDMDLSVRSYNCLKRANIHTIEDLTKKSEDDMLKVRNLGRKSLDEVIQKLESLGLSLKEKED